MLAHGPTLGTSLRLRGDTAIRPRGDSAGHQIVTQALPVVLRESGFSLTAIGATVVPAQGTAGVAAGVVCDLLGNTVLFATGLALSGLGRAVLVRAIDRGLGTVGVLRVWCPYD